MTSLYEFQQNNSGGQFDTGNGLAVTVLIEAENEDHANVIAEGIGIYFDGVYEGRDCERCGERWTGAAWNFDSIDDYLKDVRISHLNAEKGVTEIAVHYLDGRVVEMTYQEVEQKIRNLRKK